MSKRRSLTESKAEFLDYYSKILPDLDLETYLTKKNPPVLLISPFHEPEIQKEFQKLHYSWLPLDWFPHTIYWPSEVQIGTPLPGFKEGWLYSLNPSSLLPILALHPHPKESILDASAAPGGKTLAMLVLGSPTVIANDVSMPRFKRLRTTLKLFGYPDIPTTRHPVQALPHVLTGQFDKILLDAPCSSEKHVFNSKQHLKLWSPNRIATLAHLQKLLITTLLPLLKPNGILVYSTCALSHEENEDVVKNFRQIKPAQRYNDPDSGFDPMFVAILARKD